MWPCIAVTKVPCVYKFTFGKVCAAPNNPAPTNETTAVPNVQFTAVLFGCFFSPFRYMLMANNAIAKNANGSNAEKIPPIHNQYDGAPM